MAQRLTATSERSVPGAPGDRRGAVFSIEHARRRRSRPAPTGELIRVLVVGRHALARAGLRRLLEDDRGLVVIGEAATGAEAWRLVSSETPDVVVLDTGSLEAVSTDLTDALDGRTAVLLLTDCDADDGLLAALRAGATSVLPRDSHPAQLAFAIRTVAGGGALLPPRMTRRLISELITTTPAPAR
jgi:DNA-binding NarL/FixJ family response regulator